MCLIKSFWDNKVKEEFNKREFSNLKGISDWKLLYTILLKYNIKTVQLRGIGAMEGAIRLVRDKESFSKLTEKEKEFVGGLIGGANGIKG